MRLGYDNLYEVADECRGQFHAATPFPHIVLDNFLPAEAYRSVVAAFPAAGDPIWKKPENPHTQGKLVTRRGPDDLKESLYRDDARQILHEFNSGLFLRFLSILTGIRDLVSDPYFIEGGFHCSENGGYLDIHADFSHHDALGLERRLNVLLYLNDHWSPVFGGALGLYDQQLSMRREIQPTGNRCVIFETSETSYHGHPDKLILPQGMRRKSLALYYYSVPRPDRPRRPIMFPADPAFVHTPTSA